MRARTEKVGAMAQMLREGERERERGREWEGGRERESARARERDVDRKADRHIYSQTGREGDRDRGRKGGAMG